MIDIIVDRILRVGDKVKVSDQFYGTITNIVAKDCDILVDILMSNTNNVRQFYYSTTKIVKSWSVYILLPGGLYD